MLKISQLPHKTTPAQDQLRHLTAETMVQEVESMVSLKHISPVEKRYKMAAILLKGPCRARATKSHQS